MKQNKKSGEFSFKREYKESWDYLKESKIFIHIIIGVFFLFALIGFFVPAPEIFSEKILEFIKNLLEQTEGMSHFEITQFIFLNNFKSSFFGLVFGMLLGIFPVLGAVANGYVLGFVGEKVVEIEGIFVLFKLFPHGIFELPAVFISLGLGLKLGTFIFKKKRFEYLKKNFWNSLKVFLYIVLPLLIIAAIIEGTLIFLF